MNETVTTEAALRAGLQAVGSANTTRVLNNADLFSILLSIFNDTVKMATGKTSDVVVGLTNKNIGLIKLVGKETRSDQVVLGATVFQILVTSAALVTVAGTTPGIAVAKIAAAFAKKTALAFGLVGKQDKQAVCIGAVADLAASGLTAGIAFATVPTGVGAVIAAGSIAQLILSGYKTYDACIAAPTETSRRSP